MLIPLRQPGSVSLHRLLPSASFVGCADITVSAVTEHSQNCTPGCLFAALPGHQTHGRNFISQALLGGAAAILTDRPLADVSLPQCIVPDARHAYGLVCHGLYGRPCQRIAVAGVTGTNGKTTTTWILRSLLNFASRSTGVIGTIEYNDGQHAVPASLTTPDALTLAQCLATMRDRQTRYAAIELSSHALEQSRSSGLDIDVGIITNITRDHLDYHRDHAAYVGAKAKIARHVKRGGVLVLNVDDPHCRQVPGLLEEDVRVITYGCQQAADMTAEGITVTDEGSTFRINNGVRQAECFTPLIGRHNVSNCLAAACAALHFGLSLDEVVAGLAVCDQVPGRLERVDCGQAFNVFVDYAHTDDALRRAINTVQEITTGRVIVVFGAGGNRDRTKRPQMGYAASMADHVIVTSDNPRNEDPRQIVEDILPGFDSTEVKPVVEIDRRRAIGLALASARVGDTVLVAGKGHEKIQISGEQQMSFDDVAICREILLRSVGEKSLVSLSASQV